MGGVNNQVRALLEKSYRVWSQKDCFVFYFQYSFSLVQSLSVQNQIFKSLRQRHPSIFMFFQFGKYLKFMQNLYRYLNYQAYQTTNSNNLRANEIESVTVFLLGKHMVFTPPCLEQRLANIFCKEARCILGFVGLVQIASGIFAFSCNL